MISSSILIIPPLAGNLLICPEELSPTIMVELDVIVATKVVEALFLASTKVVIVSIDVG